jgi:hypothetical protein
VTAVGIALLLACGREPAAPASTPTPSTEDCTLLAARRETVARAASAVVDARHQVEAACATKTNSPGCAMLTPVVEDSADTPPTDAAGHAALVARMKTVRLSSSALSRPFGALLDAETALAGAARDLEPAPSATCR